MAQYGGGPKTGGSFILYVDETGGNTAHGAANIDDADWYNKTADANPGDGACPIADLSIDDTRNTADLRYRCADVAFGLPAKRNPITATFRLVFGIDAGLFNLLVGSYEKQLIKWFWFASEPDGLGITGFAFPGIVTAYPHDQPLEDVAGHDIVVTFAYWEAGALPPAGDTEGVAQLPRWYTQLTP